MYEQLIKQAGELLEAVKAIEKKNVYEHEAEARAVVLKRCLEQAQAQRKEDAEVQKVTDLAPDQVKK